VANSSALAKGAKMSAPTKSTALTKAIADLTANATKIFEATVFGCRTFTSAFHLQVVGAGGIEGWYYAESPAHTAIAAAAELSGKTVWFQYGWYDPNGNGPGSGLFKNVQMATFKWI
jgi:hypothetical protein